MKRIILLLVLSTFSVAIHAQTPGEIYKQASPTTNPMDPNGDGFISVNGTGYLIGEEDNEIPFVAIPQVSGEPDNDGGGAPCGSTDIVDNPGSGAESSYVFFDTDNQIMIYRIRLARNATGAFGFSVLVDTDGKYGFLGVNADPNAVPGNPGFEFEIRFVSGGTDELYVENVDGSTNTIGNEISLYTGTNTQRSYARFQDGDCSGDAVFYDFYIPLSDISVTQSSIIRLVAATSQQPTNSILSNVSDIAGTNDNLFGSVDDAWDALVDAQGEGTPISNFSEGGCFLDGTSATPTLYTPIFDSNTRINGFSSEPEGAFLTVFTNGDTLATTTVSASGRWSVTFDVTQIRPYDQITVIARDSCEYESAATTYYNILNDLDSDNDGIPDSQEGNGVDPGADADGDDIPNYLDTNYPGFVDANMDGVNDAFDPDGDGLPNHLDADSDGDGFLDNQAANGASYDGNNDGIIDAMADDDGDGIPNSVDVDFTAGTDADFDGIDDSADVDFTAGTDSDGDGIDDDFDPDDDNDGLYDAIDESQSGTALVVTDTDGDGILDHLDQDADGDGITNLVEGVADQDGDGIPNFQDIDADGDGILDNIESMTAGGYIAPSGNDTDNDGLDDAYDADNGGTPIVPVNTDGVDNPDYLDTDSDDDGIPDSTEGNDANTNGRPDSPLDTDNDGIPDSVDVDQTAGTDADFDGIDDAFDASITAGTDNDGDGIDDAFDPDYIDTDGDGLADIYDVDNGGTAPALQDTDGDGIPDYKDDDDDGDGIPTVTEGPGYTPAGNPIPDYLYNPDHDGDGVDDTVDLDSDNDGILDSEENGGTGFDPSADADGDGILNYLDTSDVTPGFPAFADANGDGVNDIYDFDHDGIPDFLDADSDGDGIADIIEVGGTDADGDGQVDGNVNGANDFNNDGIDDGIGVSGISPIDTDGDGRDNYLDIDSDNDGIVDNREAQAGGSYIPPSGSDTDRDGIDDAYDPDNGGTSINPVDTDGDTTDDYLDTDSDGDGINDIIEGHDFNLDGEGDWDSNGNGSVNGAEGTGDADGDGLLDAFDNVVAPSTSNATGSNATIQDSDGDGLPNYQDDDDDGDGIDTQTEGAGFIQGGEPIPDYLYNPDTDGDGVEDVADVDSDNDGLPDAAEDGGTGFDPTADEDGDGIMNYLDPTDGPPTNGMPAFVDVNGDGISDLFDIDLDGIPNFKDLDSDNDGVYDIIEAGGTDANNDGRIDAFVDTDGDGYADAVDPDNGGTPLPNLDSDGDGVSDVFDVDSDNDGLPDVIEYGGTDANGDGRADSLTDSDRDGIADIFDVDSGNGPLAPADTDGDGLVDNASDRDSDGDGISDLVEAGGLDANNDGILDDLTDTDNDGLPDLVDTDNGGSPLPVPDTDGDGIRDYLDADSDGDGIPDNVEAQTDAGYITPDGTSDANGFDTAYGGAGLVVVDTDNDGIPDYLDLDSDGDGILDAIEGNDADADGIADTTPSGADTDGDGIDDTFDPDDGGTALTPQDLDLDLLNDYRDTDDDADGIFSIDEPLDINPVNGTPNYLEDSLGGCGLGFVTTDFNGNVNAVITNSGVTNFANVIGGNDGTYASIDDLNDFFIIQLMDVIPQGSSVNVRFSASSNKAMTLTITSSLTDGGTYANSQTFSTNNTTLITQAYNVNTVGGVQYLRVQLTASTNPSTGRLDAVTYSFQQCDPDFDNDGVADLDDNDDDNDGIPDASEGGANGNPAGDHDADGVLNFEDIDFPGFVDANGDNINDLFDFDGDGNPNHKDLDSDSDGIPDAVEANNGALPANMNTQGRYTIAYVQANDFDGDGHANEVDTDDGGTALDLPDTDLDGAADFLDTDADGDGNFDYGEGFDDDGDGDALNDLLARAAAFETAAGDPGWYLTDDVNGIDDTDGLPDWLEDSNSNGIPNFLDPTSSFYHDSDGDGLIDLYDTSTFGAAYSAPDGDSNGTPDYLQIGREVTVPVTYLFIRAFERDGQAVLEWATASELNNSHFTIERSEDGSNFYAIGTVTGNDNSTERIDYYFIDAFPIQTIEYYRLIQEDYDGTKDVSKIYVVAFDGSLPSRLSVYPNPASETVHIVSQGVQIKRISVIDLSGKTVLQKEQLDNEPVLVNALKEGIYLIRAELMDGSIHTTRLLLND